MGDGPGGGRGPGAAGRGGARAGPALGGQGPGGGPRQLRRPPGRSAGPLASGRALPAQRRGPGATVARVHRGLGAYPEGPPRRLQLALPTGLRSQPSGGGPAVAGAGPGCGLRQGSGPPQPQPRAGARTPHHTEQPGARPLAPGDVPAGPRTGPDAGPGAGRGRLPPRLVGPHRPDRVAEPGQRLRGAGVLRAGSGAGPDRVPRECGGGLRGRARAQPARRRRPGATWGRPRCCSPSGAFETGGDPLPSLRRAEECCLEAVELNPRHASALNNLANVHMLAGDVAAAGGGDPLLSYDRARDAMARARAVKPDAGRVPPWQRRGRAAVRGPRPAERPGRGASSSKRARPDAERASALNPEQPGGVEHVGRASPDRRRAGSSPLDVRCPRGRRARSRLATGSPINPDDPATLPTAPPSSRSGPRRKRTRPHGPRWCGGPARRWTAPAPSTLTRRPGSSSTSARSGSAISAM